MYDYIEQYWKMRPEQLASEGFDLEDLFTLLQLQMGDALRHDNIDQYRTLATTYDDLTDWLTSYLAGFDETQVYKSPFLQFGETLWREPATIITFNYDCIVESAISNASGVNMSPMPDHGDVTSDAALTYSHYNWNRALCYGIRFDEVEPYRAGVPNPISGEQFYNHPGNDLYTAPILKLHGSLTWLRYVPVRALPHFGQDDSPPPSGSILVAHPNPWKIANIRGGWMTEREIITPVLYKQGLLETKTFETLWQLASVALAQCRRLVVIGYSFPPTDFATKRLFLEAFANRPALDELVVIDPDSTRLPLVRKLTHHEGSIISMHSLEDFLCSLT